MNTKKRSNFAGFSIIEMVVVVFIMAILTTSVLVNYSGLNRHRDLILARNTLVSDLHRVQSFSLSNRDLRSGVTSSAYALEIDTAANPRSYVLSGYDTALTPLRTVVTTPTLPPNIYIKSVTVRRSSGATSSATNLILFFNNPYARIVEDYSGGSFSGLKEKDGSTTIVLSTSNNSETLPVIIDGVTGNIIAQ